MAYRVWRWIGDKEFVRTFDSAKPAFEYALDCVAAHWARKDMEPPVRIKALCQELLAGTHGRVASFLGAVDFASDYSIGVQHV